MNERFYINVHEIMQKKNIDLPRPKLKIITVTVPLWSDLNVNVKPAKDNRNALYRNINLPDNQNE